VTSASPAPSHWRMYRTLYLLIIVCVAPVVASYLAYYVLPPSGRTNYGELIEPQMPLPSVDARLQDGAAFDLAALRGHWVMLQVDASACDEACRNKLWQMRQLRTAQGKDADRIERVFLVTDGEPLQTMLMREFDGTHFLRVNRDELRFMPTPEEPGARIEDHIYMIDPLGNLMMRWPRAADPNRMKRDIGRLLKASRVG
jgi:hypothetical protein